MPIIIHKESEQAKAWTQIHSEDTKKQSIPVITSWQLNERMYSSFKLFLLQSHSNSLLPTNIWADENVWCFCIRYGELQGLNKQETAERYGKEQVHEWRRSFDIPPPNGESLEMCSERAVAYFKEHVSMSQLFLIVNILY